MSETGDRGLDEEVYINTTSIEIRNGTGNRSTEITADGIEVNGKKVSLEDHTHDDKYAPLEHVHTNMP